MSCFAQCTWRDAVGTGCLTAGTLALLLVKVKTKAFLWGWTERWTRCREENAVYFTLNQSKFLTDL